MKNYIIIPANQTEGMDGYSAMAIEVTDTNVNDIKRMFKVLDDVRQIDPTISRITYDNPMVDIDLLNDDFTPMVDKVYIEEIDDELFEEYLEDRECSVNAPSIEVASYQLKIYYDAKHSDSQVYCDFTPEEITEVLTQVE